LKEGESATQAEPDVTPKVSATGSVSSHIRSTRNSLQLARRGFHMSNSLVCTVLYGYFLSHQQAVYILGTFACSFYIIEQIRVAYPNLNKKLAPVTKYFLRAEEQLKESASVPYAMAILLTILSFPKIIAIASILTLGFADPLSAIIGISFGKRKIAEGKSVEGSAAFFVANFVCVLVPFLTVTEGMRLTIVLMSFIAAVLGTAFEMIPMKVDDNITIPIFSAVTLWALVSLFNIPVI